MNIISSENELLEYIGYANCIKYKSKISDNSCVNSRILQYIAPPMSSLAQRRQISNFRVNIDNISVTLLSASYILSLKDEIQKSPLNPLYNAD